MKLILFNFLQLLNAALPITLTLAPNVTFLSFFIALNALSPTSVTFNPYPLKLAVFGTVTLVNLLFLAATTPISFVLPDVIESIAVTL